MPQKLTIAPPNPLGLCLCGCGSTTPLAKQGSTRAGHLAGHHVLYVHGHHRRGRKHSEKSREKMSEATKVFIAINGNPMAGRKHSEETKRKIAEGRLGQKHWAWKERTLDSEGYVSLWVGHDHPMANNGGRAREHRIIMSKSLKRPLLSTEAVHHINGIKTDNRLENLEVMEHGVHSGMKLNRVYTTAVRLLAEQGRDVFEIAEELSISPNAVRNYI